MFLNGLLEWVSWSSVHLTYEPRGRSSHKVVVVVHSSVDE